MLKTIKIYMTQEAYPMAKVVLISWQEIPSMVEAKAGRARHKVQLSDQFQELIDLIAMKRGLDGTDDYLLHWQRQDLGEEDGTPEEAAKRAAERIEATYTQVREKALAAS